MIERETLTYMVGDVVKINPIILKQDECNGIFINDSMKVFVNKTAYIVKADTVCFRNLYRLDIDGENWYWSDGMLVEVNYTGEKRKRRGEIDYMKNLKVIVISGKAQHGKDFTASILKEKLEKNGKKVLLVHYADYLKYICKEYFGWDGTKSDVGREILQKIGTDKARNNNPNIWVAVIDELLKAIGEDFDYVLIPDTRFPNEIMRMKELGYDVIAVRVHRNNFTSTLTIEQKKHISETALDDFVFDYYILCDSGVESVTQEVDKFIKIGLI